MGLLRSCTLALAATALVSAKKMVEIDAMKHNVMQVYLNNFDQNLNTQLPLTVSTVLYYSGSNKADKAAVEVFDDVATKSKKMLKVMAMDCDDAKKHCDRVGVKSTPHVQIYPQSPRPHFKYEGAIESEALLKQLYKLIPGDKIKTLTKAEEWTEFKKSRPTKTKIALFSDKKKPPTLLKGLSTDSVFARTVEFVFVGPDGDAVAEAAGAKKKKTPAVMMVSKGKTTWYKEKDLSFMALHEWINVNSESGMGDSVKAADGSEAETEEAEYEKVRELTAKSQHDVCFKQKAVCAIYLSNGALDDKSADKIAEFESKFASKSDRGVQYTWMWLDVSVETEFKNVIEEQEKKQAEREERDVVPFAYPTMIFVKPPKKKREEKMLTYMRLGDGKVTKDAVGDMVEKISGGATYTRADLPKFTVRAKKAAAKKGKKEEL